MSLFDAINENRLATTSVALGALEMAIFFLLSGRVNVFVYLGIPAVVLGVISLMQQREQYHNRHLAIMALPLAGIALGLLPILFMFLRIY
jgi:hypothetical protein